MSTLRKSSSWDSRFPIRGLVRLGLSLLVVTVFFETTPSEALAQSSYKYVTLTNPARVEARDGANKWLATFTTGCSTVTLTGTSRTFAEKSTTNATVTHSVWVRTLSGPFNGTVNESWLTAALADRSPDVLQIGMQYIAGAPAQFAGGVKIAGDADYGPLQPDGTRQEGSDFNDYLGISWTYPGSTDAPEANQINCLDCSGFVRMVFGYRCSLPMTLTPDGLRLPRRSFEMYASAPGLVTIANAGTQVTAFAPLGVGDLLFFDASTDDGTQLDHVGIYLGLDSAGKHRFLSSRKTANGPTLGDTGGLSILNGTGYYAKAFRAARRL